MPPLDSLTPDKYQIPVLQLTADRTAVVTGVAGSGKSLVLLKKAKQVAAQTESYAIIVYTKSLKQFFKDELREIDPTGKHIFYHYQWKVEIRKKLIQNYKYLFIDECQDFTSEDINDFVQHGTHCWFFGDTDQTIMVFPNHIPQNVQATMRQLNIQHSYDLTLNHRLTIENAALAQHIGRQQNRELHLINACVKHGPKPSLINTQNQLQYLVDWCNNHPGEDIGILVFLNKQVKDIVEIFNQNNIPIQWKTQDNMHIDFQATSPKIITWHCAKGLQFKHVFILFAGEGDYNYYLDPYLTKKSALYVACSRALEHLRILHTNPIYPTFPSIENEIWGNTIPNQADNNLDFVNIDIDLPF
ncbi:MAG: AAA family ATPase [Coprobacter sp.]|nr:AAA family ATPase [Coprobacter sp.]